MAKLRKSVGKPGCPAELVFLDRFCKSEFMDAALKIEPITVEEYLEGEELSEVRHEYLGGNVFAMAGGTDAHSLIAGNIFAALHGHLRGGPCRAFIFDFKLRLNVEQRDVFYYPDVMVGCDPRDKDRRYLRYPKVVIEVLSDSTERTDRIEKLPNYYQVETLEEIVLVEQEMMVVTIFRREREWQPEIVRRGEDLLRLESLGFSMALADVYDRVEF